MNDNQMSDLKDFISTTVNQVETRLTKKMDDGFTEMRDGFAGVADSFEQISQLIDDDHKSTDRRLTSLEQKLA